MIGLGSSGITLVKLIERTHSINIICIYSYNTLGWKRIACTPDPAIATTGPHPPGSLPHPLQGTLPSCVASGRERRETHRTLLPDALKEPADGEGEMFGELDAIPTEGHECGHGGSALSGREGSAMYI